MVREGKSIQELAKCYLILSLDERMDNANKYARIGPKKFSKYTLHRVNLSNVYHNLSFLHSTLDFLSCIKARRYKPKL